MLNRYNVKLTLITEMLGTVGKDPGVYAKYIAAKKAEMAWFGMNYRSDGVDND